MINNSCISKQGRWLGRDIGGTFKSTRYTASPLQKEFTQRWAEVQRERGRVVNDQMGAGLLSIGELGNPPYLALAFQGASYVDGMVHEAPNFRNDPDVQLAQLAKKVCEDFEANATPLPCRPQLAMALITNDNYTLVVRRNQKVAVASGSYHTSVVGGIKLDLDLTPQTTYDLTVEALVRQAHEELNLRVDLEGGDEMVFRYLAKDAGRLDQPIFPATLRLQMTIAEVRKVIAAYKGATVEADQFISLSLEDPNQVYAFLAEHPMPTGGQLAIVTALAEVHGEETVAQFFTD